MTGQTPWQAPEGTAGRGWAARGALALAVLGGLAALVWVGARDGAESPGTPPPAEQARLEVGGAQPSTGATTAARPQARAWRRLPAPDIAARDAHTATWTGREVLVWGGYGPFGSGDGRHADGAALDPRTGAWRGLPAAPVAGLVHHTATWTGAELVVWSGTAPGVRGAAYDPDDGTWRQLPHDPLALRHDHTATWTGSEVLVWGGYGEAGPQGAGYDPAADAWRVLPPAPDPAPRHRHTATWTGQELVIVGGVPRPVTDAHAGPSPVAQAYDPAADRWRALPAPPGGTREDHTAVWTGDVLLVFGGTAPDGRPARPAGLAYEPAADTWTPLPAPPGGTRAGHAAAWAGDVMVLWGGRRARGAAAGLAYDPGSRTWAPLPDPPATPRVPHRVLWTGAELLVLDGRSLAAGLAYDPGT